MRHATDKIVQLYSTSPLFQDLIETAINTGIIATGQAITTDMTPEEIAMSAGLGAGVAMVGRPVGGRVGQAIGSAIDRKSPATGKFFMDAIESVQDMPGIGPMMKAKLGPYSDLGGTAQYGQLLGRGYGDNIAQYGVGFAMPFLLDSSNQQTEGTVVP